MRALGLAASEEDASPGADELAAFARALADHVAVARSAAEFVVVLAPQHVEDAKAYARDVEALVHHEELPGVRWVVVDAGHSALGTLVQRLGAGAHCVIVPEAETSDWAEMDRAIDQLAKPVIRLPDEIDAQLAPDSPLRGAEAAAIRRLLHDAQTLLSTGRRAEAIKCEIEAEKMLRAGGMDEEAVHVAISRARMLLATGAAEEGYRVFVTALREAEQRGMMGILPELFGSLGSVHSRSRHFPESCEAYAHAGQLAERRGSVELAADMHRCAGHAALNAEMPDTAIEAWGRAFTLLGALPPIVSALEKPQKLVILGLALAEAFHAHGNLAAARGLRGHSESIERQNSHRAKSWS
jgi:tetratricopeptide (TPR) repeat protein